MDFTKLSERALKAMHEAIDRCLEKDLQNPTQNDPYYGVRDTADWTEWRDAIEAELTRRNLGFTPIIW